jgi:hypothetical protein
MPSRYYACALILTTLVLAGCKDRQITSYRAPKDPAQTAPMAQPAAGQASGELPPDHPPIGGATAVPGAGGSMANTPVPTASGSGLTWTAPATWTAKPNGSMRKASFAIKGDGAEADFAITAFPGDTGGLHANLNRWRGQVGLPPASPAELDAAVQHVEGQGFHFDVVDFVGTSGNPPTRLLGAITTYGGNSWFFKLIGPDQIVAAEKPAYLEFLKSVKTP